MKKPIGKETRPVVHGKATTGRIVRIARGQAHGFIRAKDGREVFFHRGDVSDGGFNSLEEGDAVRFELVEDALSGARALHLQRVEKKS